MKRLTIWCRVHVLVIAILAVAVTGLSGCAYEGGSLDNPLTRRFTWFSFVAGDDIRAACVPGVIDRYRVVYNGFWHEQVRIYELGSPDAPMTLRQRVLSGMSVSFFSTHDWRAPWRGEVAETPLDKGQLDRIVASFDQGGMFQPPPVGLMLPSDGYYWTAVGCHGGKFFFTAWLYPDEGFARLTFPKVLMTFDRTSVLFQDPDPENQILHYDQTTLQNERWYIEVEKDGLSTSGSF